MTFLSTFKNAWKIEDLRKKILYTLFIILIFRVGACLPVPFISSSALTAFFNGSTGQSLGESILGYFNMLSGNALQSGTVFALTIQPYINASIIIQLLTFAIPALERLQKEGGEEGKRKLMQATRWSTVAIAIIQAIGYYVTLNSYNLLSLAEGYGVFQMFVIIAVLVAGSCLVMWLGESINEKGIGNGISIILFAGIISRGVDLVMYLINEIMNGRWYMLIVILVLGLAILGFIVFMDSAERRIPIQYAKRQIGRKLYGGQNTHLPIKVAMAGVMPIIFTFAIVSLPATIALFFPNSGYQKWVQTYFSSTTPLYMILVFVLIIAFNYFYISIQYNTVEIANNIKNNGGTIPGIRPGKPTSDFIQKVVNRITLFGALFLGVIALLPYIFQLIFPASSGLAIGGTSLMILVSVAIETAQQLESQMMMRNYKGFLE